MLVKLYSFDDTSLRYSRLRHFKVPTSTLISHLKVYISQEYSLIPSAFHLECSIYGKKLLLTDSFPLSFFCDSNQINIQLEMHNKPLPTSKSNIVKSCVSAILSNDTTTLAALLSNFASLDLLEQPHTNGWLLIHYTCVYGQDTALQLLIELGSSLNAETADSWTPLLLAAAHGQIVCLQILLRHPSIQVNRMTSRGSALHVAVEYNHLDIVSLLLNRGALPSLENKQGQIALELAHDEHIIELIPKIQGAKELLKYSEKSLPAYSGTLIKCSLLRLCDKAVFLNINLKEGCVEEFSGKDEYLKQDLPRAAFSLMEIEHIRPVSGTIFYNSYYYFEVVLSMRKLYYYTKIKTYRDSWISNLCDAVNYCHIHLKCPSVVKNFDLDENIEVEAEVEQKVMLESFERLQDIGSGSFGTVYKVMKKDTGVIYAMKVLSKAFLRRKDMLKYAISEVKIMQQLSHPFVLTLYYAFENFNSLYLVLEYCSGGDLEYLLETSVISPTRALEIITEIVLGLEYIHSLDIIYRDLKPANILIDSEGHIRLADFGLARDFGNDINSVSTLVGSPAYISPEVLFQEKLTKKVDIYALGIVIHEVFTGKLPFTEMKIDRIFESVKEGNFAFSNRLNKDQKSLVCSLVHRNPKKRPGFKEIKMHRCFKGVDWNAALHMSAKLPEPLIH